MGADGLGGFHKWKNCEQIIKHYTRYVYPRPGSIFPSEPDQENIVIIEEAPQIEISSSFIRNAIKEGKVVDKFMPEKVAQLIDKYGYYK
jgi:nicotinate-nucleotide adenylyltransferase